MEHASSVPVGKRLVTLFLPVVLILLGFTVIGDTGMAIVVLLFLLPIVLVAVGAIAGYQRERWWIHALAVGLATLIAVFTFANSSALVYVAFFVVADLVGYLVGWLAVRTLAARDGVPNDNSDTAN